MPEVKIKTDVAGRVCSIALTAGSAVNAGDEVFFVEAMKMEIPVTAPTAGTLKSILVKVDDMVTEDQVVALLES